MTGVRLVNFGKKKKTLARIMFLLHSSLAMDTRLMQMISQKGQKLSLRQRSVCLTANQKMTEAKQRFTSKKQKDWLTIFSLTPIFVMGAGLILITLIKIVNRIAEVVRFVWRVVT